MDASNVTNGGGITSSFSHRLFEGKQFWLSQNIPQRSRFKELIQQHGGIIRLQEKDADILLVDHARKNLPFNSYSYQYVERSVRNGRLEPLEAYRTGPSAHRPEGATNIPRRNHRLPYTLQDDQLLWDYMQKFERDESAMINGRRIYQEFADMYPRHTYQSYRDHYLKRLRGRPRPGGMPRAPAQAPATAGESVSRIDQHRPPPPSHEENRRQISTGPSSSVTEVRKRKRTQEDEPSEPQIPRKPDTPSRKRRIVDANEEGSAVKPRELHREEPRRTPQQAAPTHQTTENPEPQQAQHIEPPTIPEPPSDPKNTVDPLFLELPFLPPSPEPEEEAPEQDIDSWIDERLKNGRATETQVIESLRCTSMNPDLADKVLHRLVSGKGIPNDIPGVWTAEDDRCIEGQDARSVDRVLKKHGEEFFNSRWEYLRIAREAGLKS